MGWCGPENERSEGDYTVRVFCPSFFMRGLALTAWGSQTPTSNKRSQPKAVTTQCCRRQPRKGRISRSEAQTIRRRRDRLKGQPQQRQHSAAIRRDAGPTAPGEAFDTRARDGSPQGRNRSRVRFTTARPAGDAKGFLSSPFEIGELAHRFLAFGGHTGDHIVAAFLPSAAVNQPRFLNGQR